MDQLYYLAVLITWVTLFMCVRHAYGVVREYSIQHKLPAMTMIRSQAFVVTTLILFGSGATYGMNYVYTLHLLTVH